MFDVDDPAGAALTARVSADSRYRLFVNGHSASVGPCKGDRFVRYYETVDLTPYLKRGRNVAAAKVVHYGTSDPFRIGADGPASVWRSARGVFLFDGVLRNRAGDAVEELCTDERWECLADEAIEYAYDPREPLYVGGTERADGRKLPHGWETGDDRGFPWRPAVVVSRVVDPHYGQLTSWPLAPRPIPPLYETERTFLRAMRGAPAFLEELAAGGRPHTVPAGETLEVELDAGELTTGYLGVELFGGRGAEIELLCSECYEKPPEADGRRNKGVRDDPEGKRLYGTKDTYVAAGVGDAATGRPERYEPFEFRAFRFVKLTVRAAGEPLQLRRISYRETGYPLRVGARFDSSDASLVPLWDISVRTLRRCMHETFEDCPYYEQLQYLMDTRLQALFSYQLSGDDALARRALFDFHRSMLPDGMLQSRYPSAYPQVIPGFALQWIFMLADHYRYFGDDRLVRRLLPTVDAVLGWFDEMLDDAGLVGKMPAGVWPFVDWVEAWRDNRGVPRANERGPLTVYSLMYAAALRTAGELNEEMGRPSTADEYVLRAEASSSAVRRCCWSEEDGLFTDGPGVGELSQHTQIWAVLSGAAAGEDAEGLIDRMLARKELPAVSYAMAFYLFRGLERTGRYERSFPMWDVWRGLAAQGLTTWVEDPVSQRSDCHGWGAAPIYEFASCILGVRPGAPGYRSIVVRPQPGPLQWAEGVVATAVGDVAVAWRRSEDGELSISVRAPAGVPLTIELPGCLPMEYSEGGEVRCEGATARGQ
jgi:hypothetical protein